MKRRLAALAVLSFVLLPGCFDFFIPYPDVVVSPPPSPSPSPIILPPPAPIAKTFGVPFSPAQTYNPLTDTLRYNNQTARLCYEGLFEPDNGFSPRPLLCAAIETAGSTRFTLTLREEVFFHDGSPLTADDVVYSFNQAQRPGGPYTARLACVSAVTAQADGSVSVTMYAPVWNAAALFDFPIIKESSAAVPPGTGPYRMTLTPDGGYLLPSENWWQGKPLPAGRIELIFIDSADTLVYSFQYGYVSMMPVDFWDTFSPGIHTGYDKVTLPSGLMQYIGLNTQKKPLDRYDLRLALALALDRQGAAGAVYGDDASPAGLPLPPSSPLYSDDERFRYDPEEAAALFAGLGNVRELELIVGGENPARVRMAEFCAQSLREAGFAVGVRALDRASFQTALESGDFDLYYAEALPSPNFDPAAFLTSGGAFAYGVSDDDAVHAALDALALTGPQTEAEALGAVWDALYGDLSMLTVCFRNTSFISQRGLLGGQTPTYHNPYAGFSDWTVGE